MAYADPVDPATPADTDIAGQGDDRIREFKRGIRARLVSFFQDVDADPLVPRVDSIPVATFSDNVLPGTKLLNDSIPTVKLLHTDVIPADMVRAVSVKDGELTTAKYADQSVTGPKLADHTITPLQMGVNSVTTSAIQDDAVTEDKIADGAIHAHHLDASVSGGRSVTLQGTYTFAGSTVIAGAGTDYLQIDIASSDLAALPLNTPAVACPELAGLNPAAAEWPDGLIFQALIIGALGARSLRVRIKNSNTFDIDLSTKTFYWVVTQPVA